MTRRRQWRGVATRAQHTRQCVATTLAGDPCQGRAQYGSDRCGPHQKKPAPTKPVTIGSCRHCRRNVLSTEGHLIHGRPEHIDCAVSIARMDARRAAKGKPPVTGRGVTPSPSTASDPKAVKIIDMATGEVRHQMAYSDRDVNRINSSADRRPRTWNEASSQGRPGGGTTR